MWNLIYICKCLSNNLFQSDNLLGATSFQLFGIDIIFDNELNPYLLEMNKGPDMTPRDGIDAKLKTKIQLDMFGLIGLLPLRDDNNTFSLIYQT